MAKTIPFVQMYLSYLDAIEPLRDAERGRLFTACLSYAKTLDVPALKGRERLIFPMFKGQIDRDMAAYAEKCRINKKNGGLRSVANGSVRSQGEGEGKKERDGEGDPATAGSPPKPPRGGRGRQTKELPYSAVELAYIQKLREGED